MKEKKSKIAYVGKNMTNMRYGLNLDALLDPNLPEARPGGQWRDSDQFELIGRLRTQECMFD